MKYIKLASLGVLFFFGASGVSYADTGLTIFEGKDTYYQKEYINLMFSIPTPHPPAKATYYIVNEKTGKKTKLGKFNLDQMSAGFSGSFNIEQKPGEYYYLVKYDDGSGAEEYSTDTFTVMSKKKTPKLKIENFKAEFAEVPATQFVPEHEYHLKLTSESPVFLNDVLSVVRAKCSSPVTLYSKGGESTCSKRISDAVRVSGNSLEFWFGVDEDDLDEDVKMTIEYSIYNASGKRLDKKKHTLILSSDI